MVVNCLLYFFHQMKEVLHDQQSIFLLFCNINIWRRNNNIIPICSTDCHYINLLIDVLLSASYVLLHEILVGCLLSNVWPLSTASLYFYEHKIVPFLKILLGDLVSIVLNIFVSVVYIFYHSYI